ncbi:MAG TPA: hypothetical protein VLA99_09240 [Nitrospiraceae bacterium]|nr:hypothetical protein [Nitrospiraceae bacterium]
MKPGTRQIPASWWGLERATAKPCAHLRRKFLNGTSRTVMDESGSLAITAWTCADCGGLIEEVHILPRDGLSVRRPIRYAVARQQAFKQAHPVSGRN